MGGWTMMFFFFGSGWCCTTAPTISYSITSQSREAAAHTLEAQRHPRYTWIYRYIYIAIGADTASYHQVALWHDSAMCWCDMSLYVLAQSLAAAVATRVWWMSENEHRLSICFLSFHFFFYHQPTYHFLFLLSCRGREGGGREERDRVVSGRCR